MQVIRACVESGYLAILAAGESRWADASSPLPLLLPTHCQGADNPPAASSFHASLSTPTFFYIVYLEHAVISLPVPVPVPSAM